MPASMLSTESRRSAPPPYTSMPGHAEAVPPTPRRSGAAPSLTPHREALFSDTATDNGTFASYAGEVIDEMSAPWQSPRQPVRAVAYGEPTLVSPPEARRNHRARRAAAAEHAYPPAVVAPAPGASGAAAALEGAHQGAEPRHRRRWPWVIAGLVLIGAGAGLGAYFGKVRPDQQAGRDAEDPSSTPSMTTTTPSSTTTSTPTPAPTAAQAVLVAGTMPLALSLLDDGCGALDFTCRTTLYDTWTFSGGPSDFAFTAHNGSLTSTITGVDPLWSGVRFRYEDENEAVANDCAMNATYVPMLESQGSRRYGTLELQRATKQDCTTRHGTVLAQGDSCSCSYSIEGTLTAA